MFDDGEICDLDDILIDHEYKFRIVIPYIKLPIYFEKKLTTNINHISRIYFMKKNLLSDLETSDRLLYFNQLFRSYLKFNTLMNIQSVYNCIYYCYKNGAESEVVGLIRIKSSDQMPRFQFAYDSDEFTKEEIIYLIHYIFSS